MEKRLNSFFICKSKIRKIITITISIVIVLECTAFAGNNYQIATGITYKTKGENAIFYSVMKKQNYIPRLVDKSYIPQGICEIEWKNRKYVLITAYSPDKYNSAIHVLYKDGFKFWKTIYVNNTKGQHFGGIARLFNNSVVIASTNKIFILSINKIINTGGGKKVDIFQTIDWNNVGGGNASFCTFYNGKVWIGNFIQKGDGTPYLYPCDVKWDNNIDKYKFNVNKANKIKLPFEVQGLDFYNDSVIYCSISYGRKSHSKLCRYRITQENTTEREQIITGPSLSEELYINDGMLYMIFESASKKYSNSSYPEDRILGASLKELYASTIYNSGGGGDAKTEIMTDYQIHR